MLAAPARSSTTPISTPHLPRTLLVLYGGLLFREFWIAAFGDPTAAQLGLALPGMAAIFVARVLQHHRLALWGPWLVHLGMLVGFGLGLLFEGGATSPRVLEAFPIGVFAALFLGRWGLVALSAVLLVAGGLGTALVSWQPLVNSPSEEVGRIAFVVQALGVGGILGGVAADRVRVAVRQAEAWRRRVADLVDDQRMRQQDELERTVQQAALARLAREALSPDSGQIRQLGPNALHPAALDVEVCATLQELCSLTAHSLHLRGGLVIHAGAGGPVVASSGLEGERVTGVNLEGCPWLREALRVERPSLAGSGVVIPELSVRGLHGLVAVPLLAGDSAWGLLVLFHTDRSVAIRPHTLQFLHGVAQVAAAALTRSGVARLLQKKDAQLCHAQRMEEVGRLTSGVAHDFNNFVQVILGYSESIREGIDADSELHRDLDEIEAAAERAAGVTRQLLGFGRPRPRRVERVDLGAEVRGITKGFGRLLNERVALEFIGPKIPLWVTLDAGELAQVLLNLMGNARDAMPQGGLIRVVVEPGEGAQAVLVVEDTGVGMDPETCARVFEPFFTTKGEGKGTGLGLAMVESLVRGMGGRVEVSSKLHVGTTFRIRLPSVNNLREGGPAVEGARVERRGSERTVLVVEDDQEVRGSVSAALRAGGYRAVECADAGEALAAVRVEAVDLLLTDMVLPRMSGVELQRALWAEGRALPVVFMSGYGADELGEDIALQHAIFLAKPFRPAQMLREVDRALAGASQVGSGG